MFALDHTSNAHLDLIDHHADHLYAFAVKRVGDESLAEDLVQETLLVAIRSGSSFARRSTVRTWLTGILKHKIADHYRSTSWFVDRDDAWVDELFGEDGHWRDDKAPSEWHRSPDLIYENQEFRLMLDRCIAALPQNPAVVFTLREIEGLERDEICELLGISSANYWTMMHRARLRLQSLLGSAWSFSSVKVADSRATAIA